MFDPNLFQQSSTNTAGSTKRIVIPVGDYPGVPTKLDWRQAEAKKEPGKFYVFCDITWTLDVPDAIKQEIGRDVVTARQSMIVDVNAQGTGLDFSKGKNVSLNRVRDALGQNKDGQPWNPTMIVGGGRALVTIKHRIDGEDTYDEVDKIGKLGGSTQALAA